MRDFRFGLLMVFVFWLGPALLSRAQDGIEVDVELVLAVDVSHSMNYQELEIQRRGYAAALTHPAVMQAIQDGLLGRIAVTYFEWAGATAYREIVPWRLIANEADAKQFAAILMASTSVGMRRTSISGAIVKAASRFENNSYAGMRQVIDISGDGPNNNGMPVTVARDLAVAAGITINGLPLMTDSGGFGTYSLVDLDVYYNECVIGGSSAFTLPVTQWEDFGEAVRRKFILELATASPHRFAPFKIIPVASHGDGYDCLIGEKLWQQRQFRFDDN